MATSLTNNTLTLGSYSLTANRSGNILTTNVTSLSISSNSVSTGIGQFVSLNLTSGGSTVSTISTTGRCLVFAGSDVIRGGSTYGSSFQLARQESYVMLRVS